MKAAEGGRSGGGREGKFQFQNSLFFLSFFSYSSPIGKKTLGIAYVWDSKTAALEYALPGHSGSVNDVSFHPTEPVIASASSDGTLFVGELAS